MATRYIVMRDTPSWRYQVWISFGLAILASVYGVMMLPSEALDRAFIAVGFLFCLFTVAAVSKMVRDNRDGQVDTAGWRAAVWIAFFSSMLLTAWGMWRMNIEGWQKGFMLVSWLYTISSAFTAAKAVRDEQEAELMERTRLSQNQYQGMPPNLPE